MEQLRISDKYKNVIQNFVRRLKDIYREELISITLYGSAASGEFVDRRSNLNLLVVLKNTDLENLKRASGLMRKFRMINTLFLDEEYIAGSTDVFPIEFLDMQENHIVIFGKDVLKEIRIGIHNLRFQCEQELKSKLIKLKQAYMTIGNDTNALCGLLFVSFTSILHILRNTLRIKGKKAPYLKGEVLKTLAAEFKIDMQVWEKILAARNKAVKLSKGEVDRLFIDFVQELESIIAVVDKA